MYVKGSVMTSNTSTQVREAILNNKPCSHLHSANSRWLSWGFLPQYSRVGGHVTGVMWLVSCDMWLLSRLDSGARRTCLRSWAMSCSLSGPLGWVSVGLWCCLSPCGSAGAGAVVQRIDGCYFTFISNHSDVLFTVPCTKMQSLH